MLCSHGGQLKLITQGLAKLLQWVFQAWLSNPWRCSFTGAASALSSLKLARTCLPRLSSHCHSRMLRCQLCQAESLRADSGFEFVFHSLSISCPLKKTNSIRINRVRYTGIITFAVTGTEESFKGAFFGCLLNQQPRADQTWEVQILLLLSDGRTMWSVLHSKGSAGACTMKDRRRP